MKDIARLLAKVHYRKLTTLSGKHGMKKSGKKVEVIRRLVENVPEEELRMHLMEFLGIGKRMLDHEYVPEHSKMKPKEIEKILKKYGIKKWQLPKIFDRDPVAMLLGARPGDVLKIKRKSETADESIYYRLVIRGN